MRDLLDLLVYLWNMLVEFLLDHFKDGLLWLSALGQIFLQLIAPILWTCLLWGTLKELRKFNATRNQ